MNLAHDLSALEETIQRFRALVPAVEAAGRALAERVKAGGKVLPGLVKRRTDERLLFSS